MSLVRSLLIGAGLAGAVACGGTQPAGGGPAPAGSIESATFAPELAIDLAQFTKKPSGVYFSDITVGGGAIAAQGRKVTVRYVASLPDGKIVETQASPVEFELNRNVMRGFLEGIPGMRAGGTRRLIVPPALAYGRTQYQNIPPNSILLFELQLVSVR